MSTNPFDRGATEAAEYDAWYESPMGRAILEAEQRCLAGLLEGSDHPWLELGTGSGRFGGALGADVGLDPAPDLLRMASVRLPSVIRGAAQALPFPATSMGAVLAVTVFEFLAEPARVMSEISRTLRPGGRFVLGFFPRGSAWAAAYQEEGRDPRSVFHGVRLCSAEDVVALGAGAGLRPHGARSTLLEPPGITPSGKITEGAVASAGFVSLALVKATLRGGAETK